MPQYQGDLGFNPGQPYVVIEGRAPLPGQRITRQTYLPAALRERGVQALYIEAQDSRIYAQGLIRSYMVYGGGTHVLGQGIHATAWRLRDLRFRHGDPAAFAPRQGYNSARLRQALATRLGVMEAVNELGLGGRSIPSVRLDLERPDTWPEGECFFLKPNAVMDVGINQPGAISRARLVRRDELIPTLVDQLGGTPTAQARVSTMEVQDLLDALGIVSSRALKADCLHALRVYQLDCVVADHQIRVESDEYAGDNEI